MQPARQRDDKNQAVQQAMRHTGSAAFPAGIRAGQLGRLVRKAPEQAQNRQTQHSDAGGFVGINHPSDAFIGHILHQINQNDIAQNKQCHQPMQHHGGAGVAVWGHICQHAGFGSNKVRTCCSHGGAKLGVMGRANLCKSMLLHRLHQMVKQPKINCARYSKLFAPVNESRPCLIRLICPQCALRSHWSCGCRRRPPAIARHPRRWPAS